MCHNTAATIQYIVVYRKTVSDVIYSVAFFLNPILVKLSRYKEHTIISIKFELKKFIFYLIRRLKTDNKTALNQPGI